MELEGTFKIRKREEGPIEVSFNPKDESVSAKRTRRFPTYDGMRRFLADAGVKQEKIPTPQELRPDKLLSITDVKVNPERVGL